MSLQTNPTPSVKRNPRDLWIIFIVVAGLLIAGIWIFSGGLRVLGAQDPLFLWVAVMALMTVFLVIIGYATNGQLLGAFIDSTNHMSLSRLQISLWTILTLSSYLLIVLPRLFGGLLLLEQLPVNDVKLLNCKVMLKKDVVTVAECGGGPLEIAFPEELVIAMGISAVSFAGSSLITSNKKRKDVNIQSRDQSVQDAKRKVDEAKALQDKAQKDSNDALANKLVWDKKLSDAQAKVDGAVSGSDQEKQAIKDRDMVRLQADFANKSVSENALKFQNAKDAVTAAEADLKKAQDAFQAAQTQAEGLLHKNADPSQASLLDLFRGSEVGDYRLIDMGKVQMFFFTIVVIVAYAVAVLVLLRDPIALGNPLGVDFPPFSNSLNTLLGISHAAYLSNKTIDHTPTMP